MSLVTKLKNLRRKIFGGEEPKKFVKTELDPESVKTNATIAALENEVAELRGLLGRKTADEASARESERDYEEEEEVKLDLYNQEIDIRRREMGYFFSWKNFWGMYFGVPEFIPQGADPKQFSKMFRENLIFTTFNRTHVIAKFGDFGTTSNGTVAFLDQKNNPVIMGQEMKDIIFDAGALANDIQRGVIPICKDADGGRVENPMIWKAAQVIRDDDGNIEYTSAKKEQFYKLLQEKDERIDDLFTRLEEKESTIIQMQDVLDDLKLAFKASEQSAQIARNQKTKMADRLNKVEKVFGQVTEDLTKYQQIYQMQEDYIGKLEAQVKKLLKEAEKIGSTPSFDDAMDKINDVLGTLKSNRIISGKRLSEPQEQQAN